MPILLPPYASSAPSPPVLPPGEYFVLCGFRHRPQTSLLLSKLRSVIGKAVLTKGTAPAFFSIRTKLPSTGYGLPVFLLYPTLTSNPPTAMLSFRLTGIPANGPWRLIVPSCSQPSASLIITSVKQLVFAWALTVVLPYARSTSRAEVSLERTSLTSWSIGLSRIALSEAETAEW